jgi:adenylate cyclase
MARGWPAERRYHAPDASGVVGRTISVSIGTGFSPQARIVRHVIEAADGVPSDVMGDEIPGVEAVEPIEASENSEMWRRMLSGSDRGLARLRRMWGAVPSSPRCKLCAAPFNGVGRIVTRVTLHGPSNVDPLLCNACFGQVRKHPGGAEIEISVLFADIRGSTGIAERTTAAEFSRLVQHFYRAAARAIEDHDGIVDKFLGDGIMALFIPAISGQLHARSAIEAGVAVLEAVRDRDLDAGGVRVGAGIHTGAAFVGAVGTAEKLSFTALGDTVNVAARLGSAAGAGELLISDAAWRSSGRGDEGEHRRQSISGRVEPLDVVVVSTGTTSAVA